MAHTITVFDPRRGEDSIFGPVAGRSFSTLSEGLFVVDVPARYAPFRKGQHVLYELAYAALTTLSGLGFFCIYAAPKSLEMSLSDSAIWSGSSALDYFVPSEGELGRRLDLLGRLEFGECILGICCKKFPRPDEAGIRDCDDLVLFSDPRNLKCLLSYSELGAAMLITRFFDGLDEHLTSMREIARRLP